MQHYTQTDNIKQLTVLRVVIVSALCSVSVVIIFYSITYDLKMLTVCKQGKTVHSEVWT
jgi:hypothetical protein